MTYRKRDRNCLVYLSSAYTLSTSSYEALAFASESYDTYTIHDNSTNNSRLTVPSGVTKVRINAQVVYVSNSTGSRVAAIDKNGSSSFAGRAYIKKAADSLNATYIELSTPVLSVTGGDYFTLNVWQNSGGDLDVSGSGSGNNTWFGIEIIE